MRLALPGSWMFRRHHRGADRPENLKGLLQCMPRGLRARRSTATPSPRPGRTPRWLGNHHRGNKSRRLMPPERWPCSSNRSRSTRRHCRRRRRRSQGCCAACWPARARGTRCEPLLAGTAREEKLFEGASTHGTHLGVTHAVHEAALRGSVHAAEAVLCAFHWRRGHVAGPGRVCGVLRRVASSSGRLHVAAARLFGVGVFVGKPHQGVPDLVRQNRTRTGAR